VSFFFCKHLISVASVESFVLLEYTLAGSRIIYVALFCLLSKSCAHILCEELGWDYSVVLARLSRVPFDVTRPKLSTYSVDLQQWPN
jgi:hypothetical protein